MDIPSEDTPQEVVDFLYNDSCDAFDSLLVAKDNLTKRYSLYIAFCFAYIAFFISIHTSFCKSLIVTTILIQAFFLLIAIIFGFKSHLYIPKGHQPIDTFKEAYFNQSLAFNNYSFAKALQSSIDYNKPKHLFRCKVLDIVVISNIVLQIPTFIVILYFL